MINYLDLTIEDIHNALLEKKVTVLELVEEAIKRSGNSLDNPIERICADKAIKKAKELDKKEIQKDDYLFGIPFFAKDNFSTKDIESTASSNILTGYTPLFDATVIKLLDQSNAVLMGKTTLDELAMGGTGTTGHKGTTYNPYDPTHKHLIGGSSCGSANVVSSGIVPFALGSDTGDSIRKPANNCGLVGFKPTRGLISRFGLFPFAPSLDHVGYFTRSVFDSAILLDCLSKHDEKDSTSSFKERPSTYLNYSKDIKDKKIAIIKEILDSITDEVILNKFNDLIKKLKSKGAIIEYVSMDEKLLKAIYPSYIVISCAEATSNNANLDGIKFGPYYDGRTYQEVMMNARTKGFSPLIKRRFVIGSYALMSENQEEVFLRAQRVRHLIVDKVNEIFKKYDAILLPSSPSTAPLEFGSSNKLSSTYLIADNYLAIANFGGYPSMTLPMGFEDNLPYGVNITARPFNEETVFSIGQNIEDLTGLKNISSLNYKKRGF